MAGQAHTVEIAANTPPWPLAYELASRLPTGSWVLVGGLMFHVHAMRAGVKATRPTTDVDLLLNIETASATEIGRAPDLPAERARTTGARLAPFPRTLTSDRTVGDDSIDPLTALECRDLLAREPSDFDDLVKIRLSTR